MRKLRGEQRPSACLQPSAARFQPCLCQAKSERAPRKCAGTAWLRDCAAARETREKMELLRGWPAPETCNPEAVLFWAPALQCTPQITLSWGHCAALHPFTPLAQSQAAFFLSLLLFLLLKGHCGKQRGPKKSGSLLPGKQV